jgi:hypothetical protein
MTAARVLTKLEFVDLCPFTAHGGDHYCLVFADHPRFPTVGALLARARSAPSGLWHNRSMSKDTTNHEPPAYHGVVVSPRQ